MLIDPVVLRHVPKSCSVVQYLTHCADIRGVMKKVLYWEGSLYVRWSLWGCMSVGGATRGHGTRHVGVALLPWKHVLLVSHSVGFLAGSK